ncbi:MAG: transposase [Acidobacteriia bacterium]|nr:transposase [Terriglobia bacterium]
MAYDPKIHHRRSIRLKGYDYARPGWYFVTVCVQDTQHLLGEVVDGEMNLNEAGQIVRRAWRNLPSRFPSVLLDEHVVMPNHFHGIIHIVGAGLAPPREGDASIAPTAKVTASRAPTLVDTVRVFKSTAARAVNVLLQRQGRRLWQRDYFEHIIRSDRELEIIREYIRTNPQRWATDPENPHVMQPDAEPWL